MTTRDDSNFKSGLKGFFLTIRLDVGFSPPVTLRQRLKVCAMLVAAIILKRCGIEVVVKQEGTS